MNVKSTRTIYGDHPLNSYDQEITMKICVLCGRCDGDGEIVPEYLNPTKI